MEHVCFLYPCLCAFPLKVTFYVLSVTEPRPRGATFEQLIHLQHCPELIYPQTLLAPCLSVHTLGFVYNHCTPSSQ